MRIVIAPDSFKGTATAAEAAGALGAGWASVRPGDELVLVPMADGGEGTLDAVEAAVPGARRLPITVTGPDGRRVDAHWLLLPGKVGVVELASTSGLGLLARLDPLGAHTLGFGQAIAAALDHGVDSLLLALGGSASTDGGSGALTALGARFLDRQGRMLTPGGGALAGLSVVDLDGLRALPPGGARILADVTNPLLGPRGAARVFGPQKGADATQQATLEAGLAQLAGMLSDGGFDTLAARATQPAERSQPAGAATSEGAGAAGGTGYGLLVWGATMVPGATTIGEALGLPAAIEGADVVLTGEGTFDPSTAAGKVPSYVAGLATASGVPVFLAAGAITTPRTTGFADAVSLTALAGGLAPAMAEPLRWLRAAGARLASAVK